MTALALLGSGEFQPWARPVDLWCIENSSVGGDRVLVVPAASAPEGESVFQEWAAKGTAHYRALGLAPEVLELRARDDAFRPEIVDAVDGARLIFFSGGNPGHLAETCVDSPFWDAVLAAAAAGTAIGGCSAGAVFLGTLAPYVSDQQLDHWVAGMGLLARAFVVPHYDMLDSYAEGLRATIMSAKPERSIAVGIDENTAFYGDGERWTIAGAGAAWISADGDEPVPHRAGESAVIPLGLMLG